MSDWPRVSILVTRVEQCVVDLALHRWIWETNRAQIDAYDRRHTCLVIEKVDARHVEAMLMKHYEASNTQFRAAITRVVNKIRWEVPLHPLELLADA